MKKHRNENISLYCIIKTLLPCVFRASKVVFFLNYIAAAFDGILGAVSIIYLQKCFDTVAAFLEGKAEMSQCLHKLFVFFMLRIGMEVFNGIYNILGECQALLSQKYFGDRINKKAAGIDMLLFEEEDTLNLIEKSYQGAAAGRNFINTFLSLIFSYLPYYFILGSYMYYLRPELLLLLVFIIVPETISQIVKSKIYSNVEENRAPYRRRCIYFMNCIFGKEAFRETRSLGAFSYFKKRLEESIRVLNEVTYQGFKKSVLLDGGMQLITLFGYAGSIFLLFAELMNGKVSAGTFSAIFCMIDSVFQMTEEMIEEAVSYSMELRGKLENLLRFLKLPEKLQGNKTLKSHGKIMLEKVDFCYPGMKNRALKQVSLEIEEGKTVAIVGENGSGKTTLGKVITGMYQPQSGLVSHAGIQLKECKKETIYNRESAVFQNFGRYHLTLAENIGISETKIFEESFGKKRIDAVLKSVDIDIRKRPFTLGSDTVLSREFGGTDLSGGEWQRIAIARGIFRPHELILLDEPTAAIAPLEEKRIYEQFRELCKEKTAILITHRLASVKTADKIVVLKKGEIKGVGTHEELLKNSMEYQKLWEAQAGQYEEKPGC